MSHYNTTSEALEAIIGAAESFMDNWSEDDGMSKADRAEYETERAALDEATATARNAVNTHAELVASLRQCLPILQSLDQQWAKGEGALTHQVRELLAKVTP